MCGWVLNLESMAELWGVEGEWFINPPDSVCRILCIFLFVLCIICMFLEE